MDMCAAAVPRVGLSLSGGRLVGLHGAFSASVGQPRVRGQKA